MYVHSNGQGADELICAGCIKKIEIAYGGNGKFAATGIRFRKAVQEGTIEIEDYSNYHMTLRFLARSMGLPFLPTRSPLGTDIINKWGFPGSLIMGMFLDPAAIVMMTTPIILPILNGLDVNVLWFGILMTVNMCAGNISPPMGLNLYIVKGLVPPEAMSLKNLFYGAVPFILIDMVTIGVIMIFPGLATWLPGLIIAG